MAESFQETISKQQEIKMKGIVEMDDHNLAPGAMKDSAVPVLFMAIIIVAS